MYTSSGSSCTNSGISVLGKSGSTFYSVLTEEQETNNPVTLLYLTRDFRSFIQIEGF